MNAYKQNALDKILFVYRHKFHWPIVAFSAMAAGFMVWGVVNVLDRGGNVFLQNVNYSREHGLIIRQYTEATRDTIWPMVLNPFYGDGIWLAVVVLAMALAIGGSWLTYLSRSDFAPNKWHRFVLSGYALPMLIGAYAIYAGIVTGWTWWNLSLAAPFLVVLAYAAQAMLTREAEVAPHVEVWKQKQHASGLSVGCVHQAVRSTKNFDSVVGMEDLKAKLEKAGKEVVAAKNGSRNGILLYGLPGNGKTMIAEALAGHLKLPIISVSFGDVASKWINQTTEQVKQVFDDARRQAPCVLFIDEIDSLLVKREDIGRSDSEVPRTVNAMLTELVNLRGKGVVMVAATNFLERLDAAAIREGRFDYKIEIPCPDEPARKAILRSSFAKHAAKGASLTEDVLARAARRWEGFSAARMAAVGREIAEKSMPNQAVSFELMMAAMRSVQGRGAKVGSHVPVLADMALPVGLGESLAALSTRMAKIVEIEELGGTVPRGVLFKGPAGTGKTLAAQSLAKTADWAFISVAGSDLVRDPAKIEKVFADAADVRPCVVFIDESDDLLQNREYSATADCTNKFLTVMDGAGGKTSDVMIIAATNFPERLDPAVLRGGRFTEKVEFSVSDESQAAAMVQTWLRGLKLPAGKDLTVEALAELLSGCSPANIRAALQMAVDNVATRRVTGGNGQISLRDVRAAIESI